MALIPYIGQVVYNIPLCTALRLVHSFIEQLMLVFTSCQRRPLAALPSSTGNAPNTPVTISSFPLGKMKKNCSLFYLTTFKTAVFSYIVAVQILHYKKFKLWLHNSIENHWLLVSLITVYICTFFKLYSCQHCFITLIVCFSY